MFSYNRSRRLWFRNIGKWCSLFRNNSFQRVGKVKIVHLFQYRYKEKCAKQTSAKNNSKNNEIDCFKTSESNVYL